MIKQAVNWIVATRPSGTSDSSAASTKFVTNLVTANGSAPVGQLPGTTTNDNASTGNVGEFVSVTVSTAVMTTNTLQTVASAVLTGGDWDVRANLAFTGNTATLVGLLIGSVSATTATLDVTDDRYTERNENGAAVFNNTYAASVTPAPTILVGPARFSLATTSTTFLVAMSTFTTSTCNVAGTLAARRVR